MIDLLQVEDLRILDAAKFVNSEVNGMLLRSQAEVETKFVIMMNILIIVMIITWIESEK